MNPPIIRVIDTETNGLDAPIEVCEFGFRDLIKVDGGWGIDQGGSQLFSVSSMSPGARAAHHISMADLAGLPPFDAGAMWVDALAADVVVVAAHNMEFDAPLLGEPRLPLLCTYKAALRVWPDAPSHSNGALRYWLQDQGLIAPEHELTMPPHRAGPDSYVTAYILSELLKHTTARQMEAWTREPRLLPKCPIGKFRGKPWAAVEGGFLSWILKQDEMDADLKWNARRELDRRAAPPPPEPEPEPEAEAI